MRTMHRRHFLLLTALLPTTALAAPRAKSIQLVEAARSQIGRTVIYDPAYVRLKFPAGDIDEERGVCTDVVVRAYRKAFGIDLQALVNADMRTNFSAYPKGWGLKKPDANIDHRRVPNLQVFFRRKGASLPVPNSATNFAPGDLVTMTVAGRLPHIAIVSDRKTADGKRQMFIHNIGAGTREEDVLFQLPLTGHYRYAV